MRVCSINRRASVALIATSPNSLSTFLALYAVAGIAGSGQGPLGYAKSVASWFDEKRGLALGVTMAGIGIGAIGFVRDAVDQVRGQVAELRRLDPALNRASLPGRP